MSTSDIPIFFSDVKSGSDTEPVRQDVPQQFKSDPEAFRCFVLGGWSLSKPVLVIGTDFKRIDNKGKSS